MIMVLLALTLAAVRAVAGSLPVIVVETPTTVELHLRIDERVDPGSVEVEIAGRTVTIHARDAASGERIYERRFHLHEPVVEEHATAEYERGRLTVVLHKRPPAPE